MEQKLDGLVTLLTSAQSTLQAVPSNQEALGSFPRSPVSLDFNATINGPSATRPSSKGYNRRVAIAQPVSVSGGTAPVDLARGTAAKVMVAETDEREAENMLSEFRANMTEQFPFVIIHPDTTSQFLFEERPLLWKAIMVAASHGNSDRQLALGADMFEDLITRLLFRAEKSLDLLQALLVFIAWYHYHIVANPQITNLLHLAKALINNMGLNRPQTAYDRGRFLLDGHHLKKPRTPPSNGPNHSRSDEWRALAGYFYVASVVSASCRGLELQFNMLYILECCQKLEEAGEYQSDSLLVQLTRLQAIRYRMGRSFPYDDPNASRKSDAPIELLVRTWQMELEAFWVSLPAKSQTNKMLLTTYHTAQIALYEIDIGDCTMCLPRTTDKFVERKGRIEFIHASLLATRKVFDVHASIPVEKQPSVCLTLWIQFQHALLNGIKLLTIETDAWEHASTLLMFPDILHHQVKVLEEVISHRGLFDFETAAIIDGKEEDIFVTFLAKIRYIVRLYESLRVSKKLEVRNLDEQSPGASANAFVEAAESGDVLPVFDDSFWQTFFDDSWALVGDGFGM